MKKILIGLFVLFTGVAVAETITVNWYNGGSVYDTTTCTVGDDLILPSAPTKYGYTFRGWRSYIPIEYIESTGTQYIDTGYMPSQLVNPYIEMTFQYTNWGGGESQNGAGGNGRWFKIGLNGSTFVCQAGGTNTHISFGYANTNLHTVKLDTANGTCTFDNQEQSLRIDISQINYPLLIGAINLNGSVTQYSSAKYYGYKLYGGNTLVRDFTPALDTHNIPCMYDKVSNTFFYNAGTGDFVAGPPISE